MRSIYVSLLLLFFLSIVPFSYARIGVGVGTGKIRVDEQLKPGTIYKLPSLTVLNTGDEASEYEVSVSYHEQQREMRPPESWFIFSPKTFHLDPGKVEVVDIKLNLPVSLTPGEYFAYVEAHPVKKSQAGKATIGIAAATKLYFTTVPANIFEGIYYKVASFWKLNEPWSTRIASVLGLIIGLAVVMKFFKIEIKLKKTGTDER